MNKRLILSMVLVAIISLTVATWYFVGQTNETDVLRITDFWVDDSWGNPVGLLLDCRFNFTLHNIGTRDLDGLDLKVRMFINDVEIEVGNYFEGVEEYGLVSLGAGEVREFTGTVLYTLRGNMAITPGLQPDGASYMVMVMLDDAVLDECKVSI